MGRFEKYVDTILNSKYVENARRDDLKDEMLDHLNMSKAELIAKGLDEEEAESEAIRKFGETNEIKNEFRKVFNPLSRLKSILNGKKILKEAAGWAFTIFIALFISLTLRSYVFATTEVKQSSMQNTLYEGQRLVEYKAGYLFSSPKRGDIVVINRGVATGIIGTFESNVVEFFKSFYDREDVDKKRLIKRVIGVPGDTIDIHDGKVYINQKELREPYVKGITFDKGMEFPLVVPAKKYFVMGDNREVSLDSRMLGLISSGEIEGKAVFRLWPFNKIGDI